MEISFWKHRWRCEYRVNLMRPNAMTKSKVSLVHGRAWTLLAKSKWRGYECQPFSIEQWKNNANNWWNWRKPSKLNRMRTIRRRNCYDCVCICSIANNWFSKLGEWFVWENCCVRAWKNHLELTHPLGELHSFWNVVRYFDVHRLIKFIWKTLSMQKNRRRKCGCNRNRFTNSTKFGE